jgi:ribosomal-protein-alanine N-acetyltransferase
VELEPPILTTERLILRTASEDDAGALAAYVTEERAFHKAWGPRRPEEWYTEAFWRQRVAEYEERRRNDQGMMLLILDREGGDVLGRVNFSNVVRGAFHACHLGYELRESAQGRGIMTEAAGAAIGYAFETWNLHRVMANHRPNNDRSERVLRRLGFTREGMAERYLFIDGQWHDHVLNSLINEEWVAPDVPM